MVRLFWLILEYLVNGAVIFLSKTDPKVLKSTCTRADIIYLKYLLDKNVTISESFVAEKCQTIQTTKNQICIRSGHFSNQPNKYVRWR